MKKLFAIGTCCLLCGLFGCEDSGEADRPAPVAAFTTEKESYAAGEKIGFTNTSSFDNGEIIAYEWDFGDESARSTKKEPVKVYNEAGTYTVRLAVTGSNGMVGQSENRLVIREDDRELVADFTFEKEEYAVGEPVSFVNRSSFENGEIVGYLWEFGSGEADDTSTEENPSKRYSASGDYTVQLTVTTDNGREKSCQKTVTVYDAGTPPVAAFSAAPEIVLAGDEVTFTDLSTDEDGTVVGWVWEFGDGATSAEQHPKHTYPAKGAYKVTLTVTDDAGVTDKLEQTVNVWPGVVWSQEIEASSTLRGVIPTVGLDGTIYVTSDKLKLYAYDKSGSKRWEYDLSQDGAGGQQKSSACIGTDGTVYILAGGSDKAKNIYLYAIRPDGTRKWRYAYPLGAVTGYTSPAIHISGNILIGNQGTGGSIILVDKDSGQEVWRTLTVGGGLAGMIASDKAGTAYFGLSAAKGYGAVDGNGNLKAFNVGDTYDVNGTSIAIDAVGNTYAGVQKSGVGAVVSCDAAGNQRWVFTPDPAGKIDFSGPVLGADGTVYISVNKVGGQIAALDGQTGRQIWQYLCADGFGGTPAVDCYGNIHCGDNAGWYHVVKPDGTLLFKKRLGTNMWSSPVIADDGMVYVNLKDGAACKLIAFDMGLTGPANSPWPQRACTAAHMALQR